MGTGDGKYADRHWDSLGALLLDSCEVRFHLMRQTGQFYGYLSLSELQSIALCISYGSFPWLGIIQVEPKPAVLLGAASRILLYILTHP